jgi:hypothetical protein
MIELTSSVPALEPATPPAAPFITVNAWAPFARPFFVNTGEDVHWPPLVDPPLFKLLKLSAASPSIWAVKAPPLEEGTILNEISVPGTIHQFKLFEEDKKNLTLKYKRELGLRSLRYFRPIVTTSHTRLSTCVDPRARWFVIDPRVGCSDGSGVD